MHPMNSVLALIVAMAVAATGLAFLASASAEEKLVALHVMAPASTSLTPMQGEAGVDVGSAAWRRVLHQRGKRARGDLAWRWRRIPPSGPSNRGHAIVTVAPEVEEKKEGVGSRTRADPSSP